ncbi:hypothetical protein AQUCO_01300755v1 [Aquilegia coerulea]|uniref:Uncharacterized protein n=1 Tax=Aquilegia coerulea TaxID=218851 RepID=A0A2G5E393_AQUCA|nr:hypothetical protein AQUCO_01300755v1 [Aquilegia coerulea]
MAMRTGATRLPLKHLMENSPRIPFRYFSDKGRVLSEEEQAIENVYIVKMERERLEKLKKKLAAAEAEKDKDKSASKV